MNVFEAEIDGRAYAGVWRRENYDRLAVESDHGSTYVYLDGRDPVTLARSVLAQLVRRAEPRHAA